MSLCHVVHTGDIKHQYEVFFNLRDLAVMLLCRQCELGLIVVADRSNLCCNELVNMS